MANNSGKKSGTQLNREINDILAARQKREARERTAKAPARSGIPGQRERNELAEAQRHLSEVERAPLADRKEAAATFLAVMRDNPGLVAERIGWLLDGNYGYGSMLMAKRVLASPRMNRSAALTHLVAAFEWRTPNAMARAAWNALTKSQQSALEIAVQGAILDAEREA